MLRGLFSPRPRRRYGFVCGATSGIAFSSADINVAGERGSSRMSRSDTAPRCVPPRDPSSEDLEAVETVP